MNTKIQFRGGFVIACEFSAIGGVTYDRQVVRQEEMEREEVVIRKVDNIDLHKESKTITGSAYYAMDRACANTPVGYIGDAAAVAQVRENLEDIKSCAAELNQIAELLGSARRVTIAIYPMKLDITPSVQVRLTEFIHERLVELMTALRTNDRMLFAAAWDRARNIEKIVIGRHSEALRLALALCKDRRDEMLEAIRSGNVPKLDLSAIDQVADLFETTEVDFERESTIA